jgi:hypothetical protein
MAGSSKLPPTVTRYVFPQRLTNDTDPRLRAFHHRQHAGDPPQVPRSEVRCPWSVPLALIMEAAAPTCCSLVSVPLMRLVPYAQDRGIPAAQAGGIVAVMMFAAIAVRC